jgi:glycosyltransferase involved in cell wall biosynthesis
VRGADVIIDCTELLTNPINTGIQRVVRQLLLNWPDDTVLQPVIVRFAGDELVRLAVDELVALAASLSHRPAAAFKWTRGGSGAVSPSSLHFVPELFYDPARCRYYERLVGQGARLAVLTFDFLPYLRPDLFHIRETGPLMEYLRLVRTAPYVAAISAATRDDFLHRLRPRPVPRSAAVLSLGSDGLPALRQQWTPSRSRFLVLGSIDRRKNQQLVLEAFQRLWAQGVDAQLTIVGAPLAGMDAPWLRLIETSSRFEWLPSATDRQVAALFADTRCSIYVSEAEGFGLPPLESLHVGVPVIASRFIPSLNEAAYNGVLTLDAVTPATIADAVSTLMQDVEAKAMWDGAASNLLPTWANFGRETAAWLDSLD